MKNIDNYIVNLNNNSIDGDMEMSADTRTITYETPSFLLTKGKCYITVVSAYMTTDNSLGDTPIFLTSNLQQLGYASENRGSNKVLATFTDRDLAVQSVANNAPLTFTCSRLPPTITLSREAIQDVQVLTTTCNIAADADNTLTNLPTTTINTIKVGDIVTNTADNRILANTTVTAVTYIHNANPLNESVTLTLSKNTQAGAVLAGADIEILRKKMTPVLTSVDPFGVTLDMKFEEDMK